MATRYWGGGTGSQTLNSTSNWSATDGGTTGASVPGAGDTVYITRGSSTIDQGLATFAAISFANLTIGFDGTIGSESAGMEFVDITTAMTVRGRPRSVNIAPTGTITLFNHYANCDVFVNGSATISRIVCGTNGTVTFGSGVTAQSGFTNGCIWNFLTGSTLGGGVDVVILDAKVAVAGTIAAVTQGIWLLGAAYCGYTGTANVASVMVLGPGTVYNHQSAGTLLFVGVYTRGKATSFGAPSAFTVVNSSITVGGALFENSEVLVTYTNATQHYGFA